MVFSALLMRFAAFSILSFFLLSLPLAQAQIPHETLYYSGTPNKDLISQWSALPGVRSYRIRLGDFYGSELLPIASLRGADRIQLEVDRYPTDDALAEWTQLAAQGVELVILSSPQLPTPLPTDDEIRRLNAAGFSRCLFVLGAMPGPDDTGRLNSLQCKLSITFATRSYPRYEDKETLASIPAATPLLFAADYWPWYTHMDTLNLLPHRKRLRVRDSLLSEESLPYLKNIERLDEVQLETGFDVGRGEWAKLEGIARVTWSSLDHVPSQEALDAFATDGASQTQARRLVIDSDRPWSAEERARIERSPLPVEWIHSAPSWNPRLARPIQRRPSR
jgi:hypothetical protein